MEMHRPPCPAKFRWFVFCVFVIDCQSVAFNSSAGRVSKCLSSVQPVRSYKCKYVYTKNEDCMKAGIA